MAAQRQRGPDAPAAHVPRRLGALDDLAADKPLRVVDKRPVAAAPAIDGLPAPIHGDDAVVASAAGETVCAEPPIDAIDAAAAGEPVVAETALERVPVGSDHEPIGQVASRPPDVGPDERERLAERFIDRRVAAEFDGFAGVTGAVAARSQLSEVIVDSLPLVELGTVALVALVVGLHFRSFGAPLLTLLAIGISYLTSIRLIAWIGEKLGISVPSEVEPVVVVLLFGVVTDYSIFLPLPRSATDGRTGRPRGWRRHTARRSSSRSSSPQG
jgi:hypothetical protein